jgi:hypothetical protein
MELARMAAALIRPAPCATLPALPPKWADRPHL